MSAGLSRSVIQRALFRELNELRFIQAALITGQSQIQRLFLSNLAKESLLTATEHQTPTSHFLSSDCSPNKAKPSLGKFALPDNEDWRTHDFDDGENKKWGGRRTDSEQRNQSAKSTRESQAPRNPEQHRPIFDIYN